MGNGIASIGASMASSGFQRPGAMDFQPPYFPPPFPQQDMLGQVLGPAASSRQVQPGLGGDPYSGAFHPAHHFAQGHLAQGFGYEAGRREEQRWGRR